tara:strand:- start:262 stop:1074 length:813 start_codon:yes stop_codon:yes gene_type:complete
MSGGWAKFHRSLFDHWVFSFDQPDKALAWIFLFGNANHSPGELLIKGRVKKVGRGQIAMSQLTLQKRFGWSQNKLKRFLKLLEKSNMIELETDELTTIITICNYESYQGSDSLDERPNERPNGRPVERATDDQSNDNKECKNDKNEKKKELKPLVVRFSTDHMEFAKGMFSLVLKVAEKTKEPNFDKWADGIRLMNKVDNLELPEMADVFRWANKDSFWSTNILSPAKFRKQYSVLHAKMSETAKPKGSAVTQNNVDVSHSFLDRGNENE